MKSSHSKVPYLTLPSIPSIPYLSTKTDYYLNLPYLSYLIDLMPTGGTYLTLRYLTIQNFYPQILQAT